MYLKSIEVHGFKSFANKIVFQFHNGITGIVGPNGSGKSNVADAVRWVLGEQRIKQLRGSSMQDVIFSGTEARKPLSYAFVAITLDNSDHQLAIDFDEVTVARRIYRSGESEYLINGSVCRLKDVNELFYDTGIGKEGYSIIGQGQIDKILSGKPEERRELFDEAAGIVKFKRRKNAAQSKLENEKQNLVRVNDILSELEKQTGPLERQSETAKIYLKKKEALKTLDVNVFLLENNRLREQLSSVEEKLSMTGSELETVTREYDGIKAEYEAVQEEIECLEKSIEETRNSASMSSLIREKLEGQINVLKEQMNSAHAGESHLRTREESVRAAVSSKEEEQKRVFRKKQEIDQKVSELEELTDQAKAVCQQLQDQMEVISLRLEESKNKIIDELNKRAAVRSRMGRFDTMLEQAAIRKSELNSRILRAKSDEAAREEEIRQMEEEFRIVTQELAGLKEKEAQIEKEVTAFREMLLKKDEELRNAQTRYHQEQSRKDALVNMTERYEGYGSSIKKVMELKEKEKGIVGVVADIIKTDKRYETAIETALGGSIQNIVTDNEDTAKRIIRYLKVNKFGRATFLPLNSLARTKDYKNDRAMKEQGVIGTADSLVQIDPGYRDVARSLLGKILVVDHMDHAVMIARKYDYSLRMVTLDGELLVPGGAISGGAYKNSSNLLGRRREIEEMERQIGLLLEKAEESSREIEDARTLRNKKRMELEALKAEIQRKSIEQNTKRLSVSAIRERMAEEEEGFADLKQELSEIEKQIGEIIVSKEEIGKELKESENLEIRTNQEIADLQKVLEKKRTEDGEAARLVGERELETQKMLQTQVFHQANLDRIGDELKNLYSEMEEITKALEDNETLLKEKQTNIRTIEQTILDAGKEKEQSEKRLKDDMHRREELNARQKNFFGLREELGERQNALDKEVYRLNAQKEKLEESVDAQISYMWDEYEITLSDAAAIRNEEMTDLSAMKKEIASLKDQIKKLGDVNVNAIEDYKNLMERYTFLKTQHDDLVEAQKTLEDIISELDSAMRKQFTEKFAQIGSEFDKVFKELFGGGKATLELMEDEDILEAGIRVIAQPPGKKLQNMMQLSGGEKALTAISLLFAIQNLKPSPFCLLDEIEAALDESNVGRFAKYLHKLTKDTQFIVITHRRGTMEQVDRLYGITMQEKGVSTLVSVNLIDKELTE